MFERTLREQLPEISNGDDATTLCEAEEDPAVGRHGAGAPVAVYIYIYVCIYVYTYLCVYI